MKKTSIVILGDGLAGLSAAMYLDKTLARRADAEVTLINRENFILFTPMLHEVASGDLYPGDVVNPIRRILRHVKFVQVESPISNFKSLSNGEKLRLRMARVVSLNAFWEQAFATALPPSRQRGTAGFCLHTRTKSMLAFARSLRWLVSPFHKTEK